MRFPEVEVVRIGTCYELIVDAVRREYGIELPADRGRHILPSGYLKEFELAKNADSSISGH
ncbi:hypothetical protein BG57_31635 [Caballeronia grimmiae]|nr:hypothetical protein BG57_31635 [Caballeronia grimmiae]